MNYDYIVDRLDRDPASLIAHLRRDVAAEGLDPGRFDQTQYQTLIREAAQRARTLEELIEKSRFFFVDRVDVDPGNKTVRKVFGKEAVWPRLEAAVARLDAIPATEWKRDRLLAALQELAEELAGGKMGDVAQPIRILVAGGPASPAIDVTLELLGRDRTLERLREGDNRRRLGA
jgi:glutamyl-tRNA synthetase